MIGTSATKELKIFIELHNFENKNFNPYSTNVPPIMDKSGS